MVEKNTTWGASGVAEQQVAGSVALRPEAVELSVIIPARNAVAVIGEQMEALAAERWDAPWEVVVVINGSLDGTREVVERYQDRLTALQVVAIAKEGGAARARNIGAALARGSTLVFVDADDVIGAGWVAAVGGALREHEFIASRFETTRINPPWVARSRPNSQHEGLQKIGYPPHLYHASGCGLGIRKALHNAVGGFDEQFPYLEDTDYCFRVQLAGASMQFVSEAVVHYRYRQTLGGMFHQARTYARYNVFLARKYRHYGQLPAARRAWLTYLRRWGRLLRRALSIRRREDAASWLRNCGWLLGLFQGSILYRLPPI